MRAHRLDGGQQGGDQGGGALLHRDTAAALRGGRRAPRPDPLPLQRLGARSIRLSKGGTRCIHVCPLPLQPEACTPKRSQCMPNLRHMRRCNEWDVAVRASSVTQTRRPHALWRPQSGAHVLQVGGGDGLAARLADEAARGVDQVGQLRAGVPIGFSMQQDTVTVTKGPEALNPKLYTV